MLQIESRGQGGKRETLLEAVVTVLGDDNGLDQSGGGDGKIDQIGMYFGGGANWIDDGSHVEREKKRGVGNDSNIFGLNN